MYGYHLKQPFSTLFGYALKSKQSLMVQLLLHTKDAHDSSKEASLGNLLTLAFLLLKV